MRAIEVSGLVKDFPRRRRLREIIRRPLHAPSFRVLDGVDLAVTEGESIGVLGANGAGKTTLLKVLAGIIRADGGSARIYGEDVAENEEALRSLVTYAFADDRSFYWRLNGRENLTFFAALENVHGAHAGHRINTLAERLGIGSYLDQPFATYSSGVRQRFSLARALIRDTDVLLLDEPTRSIDPSGAQEIWTLIRDEVERRGTTVMLVTHHAEEAAVVCDRVLVLQRGRIQTEVQPAQLNRAARGLHGLVITVDGLTLGQVPRLREVRGVREIALTQTDGQQQLEVWCDNGHTAVAELLSAISASGATIRGLSESPPVTQLISRVLGQSGGEQ